MSEPNVLPDWLRVLFTPNCWMLNHPYSAEWDRSLSRWLDDNEPWERIDRYTARIKGVDVWIENHPYASFHPQECPVSARRATILRAGDRLGLSTGQHLDSRIAELIAKAEGAR